MKNLHIKLILGSISLLGVFDTYGQTVVIGTITVSNFGLISNYQPYTEISSTPGFIYIAEANSRFDHNDNSSNSLRVNNTYNANPVGGSVDNFNGPGGLPGTQGISGSVSPNFSTLVIKNGANSSFDITNTVGVNVFVNANFQNGLTTTVRANTNNGAVRFQDNATYSGGLTDIQHVDGYVSKVGNDAFVFPVGSSVDARSLAISAPTNVIAQLTTAYNTTSVENASSVQSPLFSVFPSGSWDWIPASSTDDDGLTVTISMPDVSSFGTAASLRLVGWNGTQWIDLSGSANATGTTEGSTLSGTIPANTTVTQIGIGTTQNPLPITLTDFKAQQNGQQKVLLTWVTDMEIKNDRFEIEHSIDGKHWEQIAIVASKGDSKISSQYHYEDTHPTNGINFYRLKMVCRDETYSYSRVEDVFFVKASNITLYPNPTRKAITLSAINSKKIQSLQIIDATGKVIDDLPAFKQTALPATINTEWLASGSYFLKVIFTDTTASFLKFSKL